MRGARARSRRSCVTRASSASISATARSPCDRRSPAEVICWLRSVVRSEMPCSRRNASYVARTRASTWVSAASRASIVRSCISSTLRCVRSRSERSACADWFARFAVAEAERPRALMRKRPPSISGVDSIDAATAPGEPSPVRLATSRWSASLRSDSTASVSARTRASSPCVACSPSPPYFSTAVARYVRGMTMKPVIASTRPIPNAAASGFAPVRNTRSTRIGSMGEPKRASPSSPLSGTFGGGNGARAGDGSMSTGRSRCAAPFDVG